MNDCFDNDLTIVINKRRDIRVEYMPKILDNAKLILDLNNSQLSMLLNEVKSKPEEEQIIFLTHLIDKIDCCSSYKSVKNFLLNFRLLLEKIASMS